MNDLSTAEGAREWISFLKDGLEAEFGQNREIVPKAFFIALRNHCTGERLDSPGIVMAMVDGSVMDPSGDGKDKLALWLRRMARLTDACGYAFLMEAWVVPDADILPRGGLQHVPGRLEAIQLVVQHKALGASTVYFYRMIERPKPGKVRLGPWTHHEDARLSGRFCDVLPSPEEDAEFAGSIEKLAGLSKAISPAEVRVRIEMSRATMIKEGLPPNLVDQGIRGIISQLREAGVVVPPLPGDLITEEAANDGIAMVNLRDEKAPK